MKILSGGVYIYRLCAVNESENALSAEDNRKREDKSWKERKKLAKETLRANRNSMPHSHAHAALACLCVWLEILLMKWIFVESTFCVEILGYSSPYLKLVIKTLIV